ncbi:MAG: hypothetical protein NTZ95_02855 [Candidatus Omnitrophica bacterium]|nr:hypothetical protein [Candidatus Omnitrophota bacterium]
MDNKNPILFIAIGVLNILAGIALSGVSAFFIVIGVMLIAGAGSIQVGMMSVIHGFKFGLGGAFVIITGIGLVKSKKWARYAAVIEVMLIIFIAANFYFGR